MRPPAPLLGSGERLSHFSYDAEAAAAAAIHFSKKPPSGQLVFHSNVAPLPHSGVITLRPGLTGLTGPQTYFNLERQMRPRVELCSHDRRRSGVSPSASIPEQNSSDKVGAQVSEVVNEVSESVRSRGIESRVPKFGKLSFKARLRRIPSTERTVRLRKQTARRN